MGMVNADYSLWQNHFKHKQRLHNNSKICFLFQFIKIHNVTIPSRQHPLLECYHLLLPNYLVKFPLRIYGWPIEDHILEENI